MSLGKQAAEELKSKSLMREQVFNTSLMEDRNNIMDTLRTLETVEANVKEHVEKSKLHRYSVSKRIGSEFQRILNQN